MNERSSKEDKDNKLDHSKGALPLYLQLKEYIRNQISENVYSISDIIPSELEFQNQFRISRITVRLQSMNWLGKDYWNEPVAKVRSSV
ncbi:MAG: GntR family transcriptional regulator [Lachnospiraceae bacterium]